MKKLFLISMIIWGLGFIITLTSLYIISNDILIENFKKIASENDDLIYNQNDKWRLFYHIFINNISVALLAILGGFTLSIFTICILFFDGCRLAITIFFASITMSNHQIFLTLFPHFIEYFGFWLSGAISFYIGKEIFKILTSKRNYTKINYKYVLKYTYLVVFILIISAFIETFISSTYV
ncbi:stage II sporulation protein M [Ancylomarina sp. DW003]|nr:stage II sporulation protein M [Ancylomarina sp. DW003]MDE5421132.1 stage II sporulation protein M [Ancylomarina sp. DW003]